ncbi:MAG: 3'-5' exonuclease [Myxococcota bacterium]
MAKALGDGHRIIRGVAGSGKTLVLMYRAKLLSKTLPKHQILVTCYTRSLAGQIRGLLKDHANIDVIHLDRLMSETIQSAELKHPGYKGDASGDTVAKVALEALEDGRGPRYRAILLDEAQDFGTPALKFVVGLLEEASNDLVIVADAAQNIFRRNFSWKSAGIQAQGRTRLLRKNYRNTREILEFASHFLLASKVLHAETVPDHDDETAVLSPQASSRSGTKPELVVENTVEREISRTVDIVRGWSGNTNRPRSIAVIYGAAAEGGIQRAQELYDRLRKAGVKIFWLSDPSDRLARDKLISTDCPVILTTIHSSKGLEFPTVAVCGLWRESEDIEVNRKLVYVAMTRATNNLSVITTDGHPLVSDLKNALS